MRKAISIAATCITAVVAGCSSPRKQVTDSSNGDVSVAHSRSSAKPISFLQVSGRWNVRAISEIGDTTATTFVLSATSSPQGWTITFPNGTTTPARVLLVAGDSFVVEAGPYPSARR